MSKIIIASTIFSGLCLARDAYRRIYINKPSEASKQELKKLAKAGGGTIMLNINGLSPNKKPMFWTEYMKFPCMDCGSFDTKIGTVHFACLCGRRCSNCFKNDCSTCTISRFQFIKI